MSVILTISGCGKTYEFPLKPVDDSLTYPSNNHIWYTSSDGQVIEMKARRFSEATPLTNHYKDGKGVITFDKDVNEIGEWAFGYTLLKSIIIPESVTQIEDSAFCGCENLTSITIPQSVTQIGDRTFCGCENLTSVTIPESVTQIGDSTFCGCENLTNITIPKSVTQIGDSAFAWCKNLTSVTIPQSVTQIGDYAFEGCYNLTTIYCKAITPPTLDGDIFKYSNNVSKIYVPKESVRDYKGSPEKRWGIKNNLYL